MRFLFYLFRSDVPMTRFQKTARPYHCTCHTVLFVHSFVCRQMKFRNGVLFSIFAVPAPPVRRFRDGFSICVPPPLLVLDPPVSFRISNSNVLENEVCVVVDLLEVFSAAGRGCCLIPYRGWVLAVVTNPL